MSDPAPSVPPEGELEAVGAAIIEALTDLLRHDPHDVALNPISGNFASPQSVGRLLATRAIAALDASRSPSKD